MTGGGKTQSKEYSKIPPREKASEGLREDEKIHPRSCPRTVFLENSHKLKD
jgi:hypothetical protein